MAEHGAARTLRHQSAHLLAAPSDGEPLELQRQGAALPEPGLRRGLRRKVLVAAGAVLGVGLLAGGVSLLQARGTATTAMVSPGRAELVRAVEVQGDEKGDDNVDKEGSEEKGDDNDEKMADSKNGTQKKWWLKNKRPGEPWPSLFCWSHIEEFGDERDLLISQLKAKFGIFACNDFAVISRSEDPIPLGPHPTNKSVVVKTWPNPLPKDVLGNTAAGDATSSYKNARTFLVAWKSLFKSDLLWKHDWTAKVDPDAVFFPERLRAKVLVHTKPPKGPGPFYYFNCWVDGGRIYGALEVYSLLALKEMDKRGYECEHMPLDKWGEDLYMEQCMAHLNGAKNAIRDYELVGDDRCTKGACTDPSRAAFHPMTNVGMYWGCVDQTKR